MKYGVILLYLKNLSSWPVDVDIMEVHNTYHINDGEEDENIDNPILNVTPNLLGDGEELDLIPLQNSVIPTDTF